VLNEPSGPVRGRGSIEHPLGRVRWSELVVPPMSQLYLEPLRSGQLKQPPEVRVHCALPKGRPALFEPVHPFRLFGVTMDLSYTKRAQSQRVLVYSAYVVPKKPANYLKRNGTLEEFE
jgi:hypothetical protein